MSSPLPERFSYGINPGMNDFSQALHLAHDLCRKAGKIQLDHLGHIKQVEYKGEINIVTEVDTQCEQLIVQEIQKHFPNHDILAEEGTGKRTKSPFRWHIDPLDGTVNYAHAVPIFCVSIGLEYEGVLVMGAVYDPNRDELFSAVKGERAKLNGKPIHVSTTSKLKQSLLVSGFSYNVQEEEKLNNFHHFKNFIREARAVRRLGSAALDLCWVACGRFDGFWELFLHPWDTAAGVVILREAGGRVTAFDGSEYDLYGTELLSSNGNIHTAMSEVLTNA